MLLAGISVGSLGSLRALKKLPNPKALWGLGTSENCAKTSEESFF